jgi:ABC-type oligopeptide transport system substrate-binding subunit
MKYISILILLTALLILSSCSGDKTDKQPSTQLAPVNIETKPLTPNTPNAQDLQPDLHLSGTQGTHISGASVTKHVSGQ